jgi:hypothetical protein
MFKPIVSTESADLETYSDVFAADKSDPGASSLLHWILSPADAPATKEIESRIQPPSDSDLKKMLTDMKLTPQEIDKALPVLKKEIFSK